MNLFEDRALLIAKGHCREPLQSIVTEVYGQAKQLWTEELVDNFYKPTHKESVVLDCETWIYWGHSRPHCFLFIYYVNVSNFFSLAILFLLSFKNKEKDAFQSTGFLWYLRSLLLSFSVVFFCFQAFFPCLSSCLCCIKCLYCLLTFKAAHFFGGIKMQNC